MRAWIASTPGSEKYLSVLVFGEIRFGLERIRRRDPSQSALLEQWLLGLHHDFADRIIPITTEIGEQWGRLNVAHTLPPVDGLMAATAIVMGFTLVTRNTADVGRTGVRILNPFLLAP